MTDVLDQAKHIYLLGIKGVAMANIALILKRMGKQVSGSDTEEDFSTDTLLKHSNISYSIGFNPGSLPANIDIFIYSAAHGGLNNPQAKKALKQGISLLSQSEVINMIMNKFNEKVAVCGCHGKTTTSSLLSNALIKLKQSPSYLVGTPFFNTLPGGNYQQNKNYFVVEADEYGVNPPFDKTPKFHFLHPDSIICTNIDFDHPDVYETIADIKKAYSIFFQQVTRKNSSSFFFCGDDKNLMEVAGKLDKKAYLTFGFSGDCDLIIRNHSFSSDGSSFELSYKNKNLGKFHIKLFGLKNISNAGGVILYLLQQGFSPPEIKNALKEFSGAHRRFEYVAKIYNTYLFDDYAHHPEEIKATISAARNRFPQHKIIIIFQPHTYSRTKNLKKEFAKALSTADQALILPIFASAREDKTQYNISSFDIQKEAIEKGNVHIFAFQSKDELLTKLSTKLGVKDVVFTMGAGNVYKLRDDIMQILETIDNRS